MQFYMCYLVFLCQFNTDWNHLGMTSIEKMSQERPMSKSIVHFLNYWLMWEGPVNCGLVHPWACASECCKKAG